MFSVGKTLCSLVFSLGKHLVLNSAFLIIQTILVSARSFRFSAKFFVGRHFFMGGESTAEIDGVADENLSSTLLPTSMRNIVLWILTSIYRRQLM